MSKVKILIVEDEPKVAEVTEGILENLGYTVLSIVSTGEEAIKIVDRMRPDLVLMDILLGGDIDGIKAAKQIHDRFNVPVVYLTAYADEDKLSRAKVTEPYGYILKPFKAEELQATIEMTLYKHEIENKLKRDVATTLRSIGDAVITVNKEGLITFMNPVAELLTGWKQEIALNRDLTEVFNIKDKDRLSFEEGSAVKSIIDRDTVSLSSESILIPGGNLRSSKEKTEIHIEFKMTPIRDDKGIITGFVLVFREITERKKAEEDLHESEERYRSLIESSEDPIYLIDRNLKYKFANKKFLSRLGKSPDEVVGQKYIKFHSPEKTKEFSVITEQVFESGKPVIYEHKSHRDGRDFLRTLSPIIESETGSVIAITVISKDISDRKRLENNLRVSEEKYRRLFETARDGVLLANAKTGEIIDVNPYLLDFFKLSLVDLKGKNIVEVIPFSTMPGIEEGFESLTREGFSRFATCCSIPGRGKIFMEFVNSVYMVDGISIIQCNVRDITKIKEIQRENIETLKYLENLFINIPIGILSTDARGGIIMSNPIGKEFLTGETIEGISIFDLSLWKGSDLAKKLRKVLETGESFEENDFRYSDKDGKQHIFFLKVSSLEDVDRKIIGILVLMREITNLKKMEEKLFQTEKIASLGQLASGVAHNIRNPLAVIKSTSQFCVENLPAHSELEKALEVIQRNADAADGMIFDLLNFARPKELKLERHLIHETLDKAYRLLEPDFLQKKIEVQRKFYAGKIVSLYDDELIIEVLVNILLNSIQAMKNGGKILIETNYNSFEKNVTIDIEDSGYGISDENMKNVFDPFFSTKKNGTGLGLSICHKIMENNNGSISIDSKVNMGTKVTLTLPVV